MICFFLISAEIEFVHPENMFICLSIKKASSYLPLSCFEYIIQRFTNFSNDCISACVSSGNIWKDVFILQVYYLKFIIAQVSSRGQFSCREQFQTQWVDACWLESISCTSCPFPIFDHTLFCCPWPQANQIGPFFPPLPKGQNSSMAKF